MLYFVWIGVHKKVYSFRIRLLHAPNQYIFVYKNMLWILRENPFIVVWKIARIPYLRYIYFPTSERWLIIFLYHHVFFVFFLACLRIIFMRPSSMGTLKTGHFFIVKLLCIVKCLYFILSVSCCVFSYFNVQNCWKKNQKNNFLFIIMLIENTFWRPNYRLTSCKLYRIACMLFAIAKFSTAAN